jgi:hypothetical protein
MNHQQLTEMWNEDSKLDATDLTTEGERVFTLFSKYLDLYMKERMIWKVLKLKQDELKLAKHVFYTQGPTKEDREKGWDYPASGKIFKPDIGIWMEGDKELQESDLKLEASKVRVDGLAMIMDAIKQRTYIINKLIEREKFMSGM